MDNEINTGYQYDRCIFRGICSINPATAALLEIILIYLKYAANYCLELEKSGKKDRAVRNIILYTISIISSNYEISEYNFNMISEAFQKELPKMTDILKSAKNYNEDSFAFLSSNKSLNDYIRFGEKKFQNRIQSMPADERSLYRILFIIIKSLCINILTYESFGNYSEKEVSAVYTVLNLLNSPQKEKSELKEIISDIAKQDCELMEKIRFAQEKLYGKQDEFEVSFSTQKGKAILVVGSNLRELEQILDEFKDTDIDIYTHDNMILAHTFPKFKEYKNLKGQFGQGMENCLLDFSTFPGPIILTKNSLFNIENLYRGRLFTTDFAYSKGVVPIKNNNFSEVLKSAIESKGFKTGKNCDSEKIGFNIENALNAIKEKLLIFDYKKIIIIGISGHSAEENEYFTSFIKHAPKEFLIISLSCYEQQDNLISFNIATDVYAMYKLTQEILKLKHNTIIFIPYSDRHTFSLIINLSWNKNIYLGKWHQAFNNPYILDSLKNEFGILEMTSPKKDLDNISNIK